MLMLFSTALGEQMSGVPTVKAMAAMTYLVIFGSLIAFSAYQYLLHTVRPAVATSYAYVNPPVAVLLGVGLAGERLGSVELIGMAVILAGVVLVMVGRAD